MKNFRNWVIFLIAVILGSEMIEAALNVQNFWIGLGITFLLALGYLRCVRGTDLHPTWFGEKIE